MKKNLLFLLVVLGLCGVIFEYVAMRVYTARYVHGGGEALPVKRILIIGDSQSILYPQRIQKLLGPKIVVLNDSTCGSSPEKYLAKMKLLGAYYRPQVIVISLCATNDVLDLEDFLDHPFLERVKLFLAERFYAYHLFLKAYEKMRYFKEIYGPAHTIKNNRLVVPNVYLYALAKKYPTKIADNLLLRTDRIFKSWQVLDGFIREMAENAKKQGIALVITAIPDPVQVDSRYVAMYESFGFQLPRGMEGSGIFQERLKCIARESGVYFLDICDGFRAMKGKSLYFENDPHLNADGQEAAAALIAQFLLKERLL